MSRLTRSLLALTAAAGAVFAQGFTSPAAETQITISGKKIGIKYHAPSMHGRKIFGAADALQKPDTVWRAGANEATAFHTDATLQMGSLTVPAGDYTLYVWLDQGKWDLIINKQTGQWGTVYNKAQDLGRVPMQMSKPASPVETYKIALSSKGGNEGELQLEWADVVASVPFTVK